jgi:pimeloyl-ACP methyl ester carboxylesterase
MPFIFLLRFLFSLISWILLAAAVYLLWSWHQGEAFRDANGVVHLVRHDWRLWTGLALVVWSFGGGALVLRPFVARRDRDPLLPARGNGRLIQGADGARLYVETAGAEDAPVLVLTHGWGLDSTIWAYARRDLSRDFRLVLWDLPSMGKSRTPLKSVTLDSFARNLEVIIRHTGADRVVLVGHSIGGMTIQTLARNHPEFFPARIAGIVLVDTTYHNPLKTMALGGLAQALRFPLLEPQLFATIGLWPLAWISAWKSYLDGSAHLANRFGFGPDVTHAQLEQTTRLSVRNSQAAQAKGNLAMFRWDADHALAGLGVPVLAIAGTADIVTKPEASRHIVEGTPGAELMTIDRANHMGFVEQADLYNRAIAAFARRCHAGAPAGDRGLPAA